MLAGAGVPVLPEEAGVPGRPSSMDGNVTGPMLDEAGAAAEEPPAGCPAVVAGAGGAVAACCAA
ncbi:MAG TPA: hypothetical protein VHD89_05350, partial [Rhodanobacteraceae bacterium]|nr:hypothetical protein [Rhodanobacteraceae bacterium]